MSRLIFEPTVHVIGWTHLDSDALHDWAVGHDLQNVIEDPTTPLGQLARGSDGDDDGEWLVEFAGRHCYRSWEKGRDHTTYIENIIDQAHGSVLEHATLNFAISGVSRSLSHELVRHRAGVAISQESQRYVDAKDIRFVVPPLMVSMLKEQERNKLMWEEQCEQYIDQYLSLQTLLLQEAEALGFRGTELKKRVNEAARAVLPNMVETRLVWSVNLRTLRHVLELRGGAHADLEIRRLADALLSAAARYAPVVLKDIHSREEPKPLPAILTSHFKKV